MAPQKRFQPASYTKTRKGKKIRKRPYYPKTVRGHRHSTAGKMFPLLEVDSPSKLQQIHKYFKQGPGVVLVIFVADWCGHCQNLKPHILNAAKLPQRSLPMIVVKDKMIPGYNETVRSFNSAAPPIEPDGFPSPILVKSNGEKISEIAATEAALNSAAINVAPVAVEAGLSSGNSRLSNGTRKPVTPRSGSPEMIVNEIVTNELPVSTNNRAPASGYTTTPLNNRNSFEHTNINYRNDNIIRQGESSRKNGEQREEEGEQGEEEGEEEGEKGEDVGVSPSIQSLTFSASANSSNPSSSMVKRTIPNNAISKKPTSTEGEITRSQADEITSFRAAPGAKPYAQPVSPGVVSDIRVPGVGGSIIGGGRRGGGLYHIMSQSAYRLAPAAVLLATAAAVMKKKTRNKKKAYQKIKKRGTKKRR